MSPWAGRAAIAVILISVVTCASNIQKILLDHEDGSHEIGDSSGEVGSSSVDGIRRYRIGKRVPNDRLVSHHYDEDHWETPKNVTLIVQYPKRGVGAIVTCLEVAVDQSSNIGQMWVLAGGVGKRFVAGIIEGNRTYWFNYSLQIYGI